jgi:pimeloyl-ACP methyl ester carboxylesterase
LTYARDIFKLLDDLSIQKVVIIGTSLGGLIAMTMASQNPKRVIGVVLNDIGPEIDSTGLNRIKQYTGKLPAVDNWQQACDQTKQIYGNTLIGLKEDQWLVLAKRAYRENQEQRPELDMDINIGKAINEVGAQIGDPWHYFEALENIPTMVLRGELSDILSDQILTKMQTRNPNLASAVIPNRGHVPLLDEDTSIKAIHQLLESITL